MDKHIGDGILAFWRAPVPDADPGFNASMAGLACRSKNVEFHEKWRRKGQDPLFTRVGISTGGSIGGNLGARNRINCMVTGGNVNLANRLEGTQMFFGTRIIVSRRPHQMVSDKFPSETQTILCLGRWIRSMDTSSGQHRQGLEYIACRHEVESSEQTFEKHRGRVTTREEWEASRVYQH